MAIRRTIAEFSDDIATADIADDAITGGKLANDIAISTTGAIAGTGGLTMDGATVFNEASADVDFRVESNGNANMLFVDAGNDRVGIGTGAPGFPLDVQGTGGGGVASFYSTDLSDTDHTHIKIGKSATANEFAVVGFRKMASTADYAYFAVNNAPTGANMVIDVAGNVGIGTVAPDAPLHIMATDTTHGISSAADNFIIEDDAAVGMTFASNNDMTIAFSDNYQSENCKLLYDQSEQSLSIWTDELKRFTIAGDGNLIHGAITTQRMGYWYEGHSSTGNTTGSYTFGLSSHRIWATFKSGGNKRADVVFFNGRLNPGQWTATGIKYSHGTPALFSGGGTVSDANNTYNFAVSGGNNQLIFSRSSGSTDWDLHVKYMTNSS